MVNEDKLARLTCGCREWRPARLYKTLEKGPMTSKELAAETGIAQRYAREWLSHQAVSGYLDYDSAPGAFTMTPEQAMVAKVASGETCLPSAPCPRPLALSLASFTVAVL
jgi:DNA-binding IclR family transcriptional regulator